MRMTVYNTCMLSIDDCLTFFLSGAHSSVVHKDSREIYLDKDLACMVEITK